MLTGRVKRLLRLHDLPYRVAVPVAVGLLLGVACLCFSPVWTLAALAGAGLVFVTLKRPEIGLVGILIATSSVVFEERLPLIPIGVGSLHIPDVVLLSLFGLIALRWLVERDFEIIRTPLDGPLLAFYGISVVSTFIAVLRGSVEFNHALRGIRVLVYYLTFFIVTNLVREERQLSLLWRGLSVLAAIVAATMAVQYLLGESVPILPGRVETLWTDGTTYGGIVRILPPGQSLVLVAFVVTSVKLVVDELRWTTVFKFLQWGLLALALVLTFNRSFWVVAILALLLLACLAKGPHKQRLVGWGLVGLLLAPVGLLLVFDRPEGKAARVVRASFARLSSLTRKDTFASPDSTFRWRSIEYEYALPQIISHPLIGLGLGARYRPWDPRLDWEGSEGVGFDGRAYVHNGHVWVVLKTGLLGYLCLLWLSFTFLIRGFRYWSRSSRSQDKGLVLGFALSYLGVMVGAIVNPMFMQWFWTPVIGLMMGANEVILRKVASAGLPRK